MQEHKEAYLRHLRALNYSEDTLKSYSGAIARLERWIGNKRVQDITEKDMRAYSVSMEEEGLKPHSISNYLLALKEFFRYLVENFIILVSPVENIDVPKIPRGLPEVLSEEQMFFILDSIKADSLHRIKVKAILEILYSTGIRRDELVTLTLERIDLEEGLLAVIGKFNKERIVPMGETALDWLNIYLDEVRPVYNKEMSGRVFLSKNGSPLSKDSLAQIIREVRLKTGIHFNCQMIRRTCATHMLSNGANIMHLAQLLGHETLETLTRYLRIDMRELKKTHAKVF